MVICPKCGNKVLLGRCYIEYIIPDDEPYEADTYERIDEIDGISIPMDIHWCEVCNKVLDVEVDKICLLQPENEPGNSGG